MRVLLLLVGIVIFNVSCHKETIKECEYKVLGTYNTQTFSYGVVPPYSEDTTYTSEQFEISKIKGGVNVRNLAYSSYSLDFMIDDCYGENLVDAGSDVGNNFYLYLYQDSFLLKSIDVSWYAPGDLVNSHTIGYKVE